MGDLCRRVYSECGAGASERRLDKTAADPDGPSESDRQILGTDCGGWHTFVVKGVMARCSTLEESQMTTVCARRLSVGCTLCSLLRYSLQSSEHVHSGYLNDRITEHVCSRTLRSSAIIRLLVKPFTRTDIQTCIPIFSTVCPKLAATYSSD